MVPICIERLNPGDEARLRTIRLRALADAPDAFGTTFDEAQLLPFEHWQLQIQQFAIFVATTGTDDVGIARGASHDDCDDTAYLLSMWVAPKLRRQGIASVLIDAVIGWARTNGFRRIILDVAEQNPAASALYSMKGFVANGAWGTLPPPRQHIRDFQMEMILRTDTFPS